MVVKDERTKTLIAHAVQQKGIDSEEYAVKQVAKDIEELGHRQESVKCDSEPITMALLRRLRRLVNVDMVDQVLHDHPASGDSQSNGSIENGVQTVTGQLRTLRAALRAQAGLCMDDHICGIIAVDGDNMRMLHHFVQFSKIESR